MHLEAGPGQVGQHVIDCGIEHTEVLGQLRGKELEILPSHLRGRHAGEQDVSAHNGEGS